LEYAAAARDGDRVLKYAQKITATPGKQDGLYADGVPTVWFHRLSPRLRPRIRRGQEAGILPRVLLPGAEIAGPDAAGGAFDYVVNGKMIGGFALVAWPEEYGCPESGPFSSITREWSMRRIWGRDGHPSRR